MEGYRRDRWFWYLRYVSWTLDARIQEIDFL